VRICLPADPHPQPYHETLNFHGFIDAAAGIATFAVNLVTSTFLNMTLCKCYFPLSVPTDTWGFTYEATWRSSVECGPTDDNMYYQVYEDTSTIHIQSAFLPNPIHVVLNRTQFWPDQYDFVMSLTEGDTCPRYQQPYELYITVWHNGEAPEAWSFVNGDK
jgi:hypothetical protein